MSANNVVTHPRFAAVPVKNPPMRKGRKPPGTAGFYAAQGKRDRERRLRARDQDRRDEGIPAGVRPDVHDKVTRLVAALRALDIPKLQRLVEEAEKLARGCQTD